MDEEEKKTIEREIQVMKQAEHPFHIEFIESFVHEKKFFCIITKFATGGDLNKLIEDN